MDKGVKPIWACRTVASDEASELEYYLQKQLEDDVARIFDESIYSDLELSCGKQKLLTHSCILKARTNQFYNTLQTILHVDINQHIFDEIYSFISDVYTECDIEHQEAEILQYLKENLHFEKKDAYYLNEEDLPDENEIFSTPKCLSPFAEPELKKNPLSPNTELTKEYYALVPIDSSIGHSFDQEIGEQDALSNAFQSIINAEAKEAIKQQLSPRNKPTSLALTSSHTVNTIQHSNSCDNFISNHFEDASLENENVRGKTLCETSAIKKCRIIPSYELVDNSNYQFKTLSTGESIFEKTIEPSYTPDSLINDEPSSSSDYLSATYTCPPGISSLICPPQTNIGDSYAKMDSTFTPSDSGVENGLLESQSSHRDITLTDVSLTESAIHDSTSEDLKPSFSCVANPTDGNHLLKYQYTAAQSDKTSLSNISTKTSSGQIVYRSNEDKAKVGGAMDPQSSKDEKQRQNEEIVNLESSSISSETGSWESIFPPKLGEKAICEKFISQERQLCNDQNTLIKTHTTNYPEKNPQSLVQKSLIQSGSCFIDAASLRDEDETIKFEDNQKYCDHYNKSDLNKSDYLPVISEAPCDTINQLDGGKSNRNHETNNCLEQLPNADSNEFVEWKSLEGDHKNTSSLTNEFKKQLDTSHDLDKKENKFTAFTSDTPHNSINVSNPLGQKQTTDNVKINNDDNNCASVEDLPTAQEKSSHTFYIDFSSLPDPLPTEDNKRFENLSEKKNMFSMFIDLGETSNLKKIPARLSSLFPSKKNLKEKSLTEQNSTASFENCEILCKDTSLTISEIVAIHNHMESEKQTVFIQQSEHLTESNEKPHEVMPKNVEAVKNIQQNSDLFVKLSDLDKPPIKHDFSQILQKRSEGLDVRMTRSIPENNWRVSHTSTFRSTEIISSFHSENALSLNRLFPHLKDQLISKSMPGSRRPLYYSNTGMASSDWQDELVSYTKNEPSTVTLTTVADTTTAIPEQEMSKLYDLIESCQSPLGQDLLRMFIEEIAPDVTVECSGRRIKAHKCILISRCQYFAGILSGSRIESAGNVIVMPPFSQEVFLFVLCYIYSGISVIPSSINIVELVTLSDMLRLEGLKEAIMLNLKNKYCHHFHSPCDVCIAGVLESFHLSSMYSLDELYRKCLKWITTYFPVVWPTKAFSSMNEYLVEKCVRALSDHIKPETFLNTVYGLGVTMYSLQNLKWGKSMERHCNRVMDTAIKYAAKNLEIVLKEIAPLGADAHSSAKRALERCMKCAIDSAPGEELCRAYVLLADLIEEQGDSGALFEQRMEPRTNLYVHGSYWHHCCEMALVYASPKLTRTQAYKDLPYEFKRKLRLLSPKDGLSPIAPGRNRDIYSNMRNIRPQLAMPHSVTTLSKVYPIKTMDLKKSPTTSTSTVRTTKAQEQRTKFNILKKKLTEERDNNSTYNRGAVPRQNLSLNKRSKSMETKNVKTDKNVATQGTVALISSSGTSSPSSTKDKWTSRNNLVGTSRPKTADPNTGAVNENNMYATYTKSTRTKKEPGDRIIPQTKLPTYKYSSMPNRQHDKDLSENIAGSSKRLDIMKPSAPVPSTITAPVQKLQSLMKLRPNNQLLKDKSGSLNMKHSETRTFSTSPLKWTSAPIQKALSKEMHGTSNRPLSLTVPVPKCAQYMNQGPDKAVEQYNRPPASKPPAIYKVSGSLTKATKSSRAKTVTKVTNEENGTSKYSKQPVKPTNRQIIARAERPLKDRSRTWSKDEPKDDSDDQRAFQDNH